LDNDGFDDSNKLKQMIKLNGGDVRVSHDEQGNIDGTVDPSIRYLVLGTAPVEGPEANPEVVEAMKIMEEQARLSTVQVIDLRKLLNWMGVHGRAKLEKIGGDPGEEFQTRSPEGSQSRDGSGSKSDGSRAAAPRRAAAALDQLEANHARGAAASYFAPRNHVILRSKILRSNVISRSEIRLFKLRRSRGRSRRVVRSQDRPLRSRQGC